MVVIALQQQNALNASEGLPGDSVVKNPPASAGAWGSIPRWGRSPGEGMATHSSILARRIPGTGEPGELPSMGSHRVEHD